MKMSVSKHTEGKDQKNNYNGCFLIHIAKSTDNQKFVTYEKVVEMLKKMFL